MTVGVFPPQHESYFQLVYFSDIFTSFSDIITDCINVFVNTEMFLKKKGYNEGNNISNGTKYLIASLST